MNDPAGFSRAWPPMHEGAMGARSLMAGEHDDGEHAHRLFHANVDSTDLAYVVGEVRPWDGVPTETYRGEG